jgi:hypothetical protein
MCWPLIDGNVPGGHHFMSLCSVLGGTGGLQQSTGLRGLLATESFLSSSRKVFNFSLIRLQTLLST